jgi:hypothetical protein
MMRVLNSCDNLRIRRNQPQQTILRRAAGKRMRTQCRHDGDTSIS